MLMPPKNKLNAANGADIRARLIGSSTEFPQDAYGVSQLLDAEAEHVWAPYWTRDGLDLRGRMIGVLGALICLGIESELREHIRGALKNGLLTKREIRELILQCAGYVGYPTTLAARKVAAEVFEGKDI